MFHEGGKLLGKAQAYSLYGKKEGDWMEFLLEASQSTSS